MQFDYIGYSKIKTDSEKALSLISNVFFKNKSLNLKKELLTKINQKKNRIIIIKKNEDIISCLVTYKKKLLKTKSISFCGLGFICVDERYRGKNISKILIESSLLILKKDNIDIAYLSARRQLDYFYIKFGFIGISTYTNIIINKIAEKNKFIKKFTILLPTLNDINFLNKLYQINYNKMYGSFKRTKIEWENLISSKYQNLSFNIILYNKKKIGYIIYKNDKIYEIALKSYDNIDDLLNLLFKKIKSNKLNFEIYSSHQLIKYIKIYDFSMQMRNCYYGGQMINIINNRFKKITNDKNNIYLNNKLNYAKKILDAKTLNDIDCNKSKYFCFLSTQEI
jgi:predicted GNAT family N-acyltransferase